MDDAKKYNLQKQWNNIIADLNPDHIVDKLYSLQDLTIDEIELINSEVTAKNKASLLLRILSKKGNQAYNDLVIALEKDYSWLAKPLQNVNDESFDKIEQEVLKDTLVLGDVPRRPRHYVDRVAPLRQLQDQLEKLLPCQRIVLHGMTGIGKSCLASAAVKDPILLQNHFHNRVFWINLGDVKEVDQLPFHMNLLLQRMVNDSRESGKKMRPKSILQEGDYLTEIQMLKDLLKNMFCVGSYREALLVLDNVSLREATQAFDVGCKTLITTQVKDIVVGNNTEYIQIKSGFTEEETLLLFAKCLSTQLNNLPPAASRIHSLCKGEPILIDLIGSLLEPYKEQLLNSSELWKYYINKLTKKDYDFKVQLFDAISLSIERLTPNLRELYEYFAVFVNDINITPQVMQTIWKIDDKVAVLDIMTELQNKSLIVSYYNQELKTYVYGIHDLFLAFLKRRMTSTELVEQHSKLISAYKLITNGNLCNLPNDNYIFQYIGYHLKAARMYNEFTMIYFDLEFIGAKIKAIGTADLLKDFHLYREYITQNDETLGNKLDEYIKFVKAKGHDLYKYQDTNVIQCGLTRNKDSFIFKSALDLARNDQKHLYFQIQAPPESHYFTHTLDLQHDVSAACFTADVNQILVGMENGDISLWEQAYNQKLHIFAGHSGRIVQLQLNPDRDGFLSVSEDGCVKIWELGEIVVKNSNGDIFDENGFGKAIPSPRVKQPNWKNFYGNGGRVDHSKTCQLYNTNGEVDKLISAAYSNDSENLIVTGCSSGRVLIWNIKNEPEIMLKIDGQGRPVNCVTFSLDDSLVLFGCGTKIYLHSAEDGSFLCEFCNKVDIKSLLIVPDLETETETLIAINDSTITVWTWNEVGLKIVNPTVTELDNRKQTQFLCGAVTEDGSYLIAGSTDYYIRIWKISTRKIVQDILNNKGLVVCLDTFYDDTKNAVHILLSGSDDKTVKQWQIQPTPKTLDTAKLLPIFDCYWSSSVSVPRIAVVNANNKLQVMSGHNLLIESDKMSSPIKAVRFSLCGNRIAIGLENGEVNEFDYKNRQYKKLMILHDSVMLIKYFNITRNDENLLINKNETASEVMLVATARNGWVTVYKKNGALCLIQPQPSNLTLKQVPIIPIVQCFYIKAAERLLSVSENRTIKAWNLEDGTCEILHGDKILSDALCGVVTMATMSKDQTLLAVTMLDNSFEIYSLYVSDSKIIMTRSQGKALDSPLMCCRFSHNSRILALGQDNGNIVIWSVESKAVLGTLHLHKSQVSYLLFSPTPALILISVGDQIGWWDLTKLPDKAHQKRRRSNTAKKRSLTIDTNQELVNFNLGLWNDKEGSADKPHLLASLRVRGISSSYISASPDFTSFFTIDRNGHLYIMEMLK